MWNTSKWVERRLTDVIVPLGICMNQVLEWNQSKASSDAPKLAAAATSWDVTTDFTMMAFHENLRDFGLQTSISIS